jgi:fructose-specific component phosphotransferase system IIB-like protein
MHAVKQVSCQGPSCPTFGPHKFLQHTMLVAAAHCQVVSCNQVSTHAPMVDVEVETAIQYSRCPIMATDVPPWAHTFVLQHTMLVAVAHCQVVSCNQVSTHAPMVDVEVETTIHYNRCRVRATVVPPWAHTCFLQHTMLVAVPHCQVVSYNQVSPHAPMVDVELEHQGYQPVTSSTSM